MDRFSTGRCNLRLLAPGDEPLYASLYTDARVMAWIAPPCGASELTRRFATACRENATTTPLRRHWVVDDRSGDALGLLALLQDQAGSGSAEIGVMLRPAAQGRGFARELVAGLAALVFSGCPGIRRVWARHRVDHAAAAALMRAVGFPVESTCGQWVACSLTRGSKGARQPASTRPSGKPVCMARPGGS